MAHGFLPSTCLLHLTRIINLPLVGTSTSAHVLLCLALPIPDHSPPQIPKTSTVFNKTALLPFAPRTLLLVRPNSLTESRSLLPQLSLIRALHLVSLPSSDLPTFFKAAKQIHQLFHFPSLGAGPFDRPWTWIRPCTMCKARSTVRG